MAQHRFPHHIIVCRLRVHDYRYSSTTSDSESDSESPAESEPESL